MIESLRAVWILPGASPSGLWLHLPILCLAVVCLFWLRRWERELVSATLSSALLALRLALLAVVFVTLLQPTRSWTIDRQRTGRIVVAVDLSESMQADDRHAPLAERTAWALGLGLLRAAADEPADEKDPPQDRMALKVGEMPRRDLVHRLLLQQPKPLLQELAKIATVELRAFGERSTVATPEQLAEDNAAELLGLRPQTTRLQPPLQEAIGSNEAPLLAVVLITDGRGVDLAEATTVAASLGAAGSPVYPIRLGTTERPKDLSIAAVDHPPTVYRGDRLKLRVIANLAGFENQQLGLRLMSLDEPATIAEDRRTLTSAGETLVSEFEVPSDRVGRFRFRVQIDERPEETRADNNQQEFTVQVIDDRSRVLFVDGEPRWEFRYLEAALARDERVDLQTVLFRAPSLQILKEPFFAPKLPSAENGPWDNLDLVILGDVSATDFGAKEWTAVEKYVAVDGGALVLIAGREDMPLGHSAAALSRLLPIREPHVAEFPNGATGWSWQLTPDGSQQTPLQFAVESKLNQELWATLPPAQRAIIGEPKPGATVWARGRTTQANVEQPDATIPLIVHQNFGLGQVLWIGSDSTWRWRFRAGDRFHHRFWGQIARWGATAKLSAGNEYVKFGPLQESFVAGEAVVLQARWSANVREELPRLKAQIELRRGDEVVSRLPLTPSADQPLTGTATASDLAAGDYQARLVVAGGDRDYPPVEAAVRVTPPLSTERLEITSNLAGLQQLADASGGRVLTLADSAELLERVRPIRGVVSLPQERSVWDRWPTLLVLVLLLTTEWAVRRVNGLP